MAKATMPCASLAVYWVMKKEPPPTARAIAPNRPLLPPRSVVVCSSMLLVIQDSSPAWATIFSPGWRTISRTGRVVPTTW